MSVECIYIIIVELTELGYYRPYLNCEKTGYFQSKFPQWICVYSNHVLSKFSSGHVRVLPEIQDGDLYSRSPTKWKRYICVCVCVCVCIIYFIYIYAYISKTIHFRESRMYCFQLTIIQFFTIRMLDFQGGCHIKNILASMWHTIEILVSTIMFSWSRYTGCIPEKSSKWRPYLIFKMIAIYEYFSKCFIWRPS